MVLVAVAVAVAQYHLHTLTLVILIWGCWHGLMQVYGFVRIYDAKVGFHSTATAYWDWLLLASWFSTAQVFSDGKMADFLELWYQSGGLLIPPAFVHAFRWVCLGTSIAILIGFLTNHVVQTYRGRIENKPTPNPVKLLLLASGIGFWWFAMVFVENPILGVAFFEIFHDVQYLAIVWLYNCRRVNATSDLGGFMKFLFRRGPGMLSLYVGLVFVYGIYGFVHNRSTAGRHPAADPDGPRLGLHDSALLLRRVYLEGAGEIDAARSGIERRPGNSAQRVRRAAGANGFIC